MPATTLPKLLIVDDELPHMRALCETLADQGFQTAGFNSASAALESLNANSADLLLTDLLMPEMDGITLLSQATAKDPFLVGIIMTGRGTIDSAVAAMKAGALDYILKPFKLSMILPVINRAIAMRNLRVENAQLAQRMHQRTSELELANKELEAFSYSVSHDLLSPVRAINGFSNILIEEFADQMPAEARRLMDLISTSASRMSHLIEDLLRFSRVSRQSLTRRTVAITPLITDIVNDLRREHDHRPINVRLGQLRDTTGDPSLIRQLFVNLLSNAFKFTRGRDPAEIEVANEDRDGERVFIVRDNGAGFDMKYANRLFGVFERLHSTEEFEGTGIGLSIVQRIVQRHGGRVWAQSQVDQGTTFYFTLPS